MSVIDESTMIYQYEEMLMGNRFKLVWPGNIEATPRDDYTEKPSPGKSFSDERREARKTKAVVEENRRAGAALWRYSIKYLLKWTPKEAMKNLSEGARNTMKLPMGHDNLPDSISECVAIAFPDEMHRASNAEAVNVWMTVMRKGNYSVLDKAPDYPQKFFNGSAGINNAKAIMRYVATSEFDLSNDVVWEAYMFFGNAKESKKFLAERRLDKASSVCFNGNALKFFHESLPEQYRDEFFYHMAEAYYAIVPGIAASK